MSGVSGWVKRSGGAIKGLYGRFGSIFALLLKSREKKDENRDFGGLGGGYDSGCDV